ncbi:hypothetical protein H920_00130 [Fukomys damarensis]|uniref:Uncharacterized protein n=1 Tax=Fukomys damarensis TaxID=885580 RepID=A0A091ERR9_FUKDA|nr:hypothetical protein H920_00130 [Fukomys damarensis]
MEKIRSSEEGEPVLCPREVASAESTRIVGRDTPGSQGICPTGERTSAGGDGQHHLGCRCWHRELEATTEIWRVSRGEERLQEMTGSVLPELGHPEQAVPVGVQVGTLHAKNWKAVHVWGLAAPCESKRILLLPFLLCSQSLTFSSSQGPAQATAHTTFLCQGGPTPPELTEEEWKQEEKEEQELELEEEEGRQAAKGDACLGTALLANIMTSHSLAEQTEARVGAIALRHEPDCVQLGKGWRSGERHTQRTQEASPCVVLLPEDVGTAPSAALLDSDWRPKQDPRNGLPGAESRHHGLFQSNPWDSSQNCLARQPT